MHKRLFPPLILFVSFFLFFSYRLVEAFNFDPDFARDLYHILAIAQGKFTLIGPKSSFGGIFTGPYYYYLFVPVFYLTRFNIYSVVYFNAALFVGALLFFYQFAVKKFGTFKTTATVLIIALLPFYIGAARDPWNGYTYIALLVIFLTILYFYNFENRRIALCLFGLFGGVITAIHFANGAVMLLAAVYLFCFMKKKSSVAYFIFGVAAAFFPLVLFELKHNFVMLKSVFVGRSYEAFLTNASIPDGMVGKKNVLENMVFVGHAVAYQIGLSPFVLFMMLFFLWPHIQERQDKFFAASSFALFVFYSFILRHQFVVHYLLPLTVFIIFVTVLVILKTKQVWLLTVVLFFALLFFPYKLYQSGGRKPETYERAVKYVIDKKLIQQNEFFNVIQVYDRVPVGHEYRFFFRKYGYLPQSEFEYSASRTLFVFSETADFDIFQLRGWEIEQFGRQYLSASKKHRIGDMVMYEIRK